MQKRLMTLTLAVAAMIAIPTAANAQDNKSEQTKECCKDKKECKKENCKNENCKKGDCKKADCSNECPKHSKRMGKGKKGMRTMSGQAMRGDSRKMKAQKEGRMHKEMRRADGENPMFKGITLSEEQKTKMKALREKNMAAEKKTKADMKAKSKEEMQKLRAEFDKEVEKILDKDQLKQYQANKADMEAKRAAKAKKSDK